jgi:methyl-accepting chemotaxis protein
LRRIQRERRDGIAFQTDILGLNAALVEPSAAAAHSLRVQADSLADTIARFRVAA